ncbi:MAG TPA: HEAT repeat domain-containing protein [Candidatus Angelobacter sp.]|jgi:HEAT repeat protein/putative zinc finger protein|nr:HEAT repeat domain-containing protein [Candidatus Angelobacter sp.]
MKCEWTKENVVLYMYDELPDDAKFEFMSHVQHCDSCRQELEAAQAFRMDMSSLATPEVSPNLLASSRMQLQEALEHAQQNRSFWGMFIFDFAGWMQQIKLAPALTAALLIVGFAGGSLTTWRLAQNGSSAGSVAGVTGGTAQPDFNIAAIDSIATDPASNRVTIKYDTLHPQTLEGLSTDPRIQELLLLAARNNRNSDVRLDSIDLLKSKAQDNDVRDALVSALRYDKNPGVRLKALDGLKGYVKDDIRVRDAVLEALLHDSNPGVRSEAISLLDPVKADSSVREALQVLAQHDSNQYIKTQSQKYLASTPHLD